MASPTGIKKNRAMTVVSSPVRAGKARSFGLSRITRRDRLKSSQLRPSRSVIAFIVDCLSFLSHVPSHRKGLVSGLAVFQAAISAARKARR